MRLMNLLFKRCWRCLHSIEEINRQREEIQIYYNSLIEKSNQISQEKKMLIEKTQAIKLQAEQIENSKILIDQSKKQLEEKERRISDAEARIKEKSDEIEKRQAEKDAEIRRIANLAKTDKAYANERHRMAIQIEEHYENYKRFLEEKERAIEKQEINIVRQKEALVGQDSIEQKRDIIMPSLKAKWEAERKKLDAERVKLMTETPKVTVSIEARKNELIRTVSAIKKKPMNSTNHDLLIQFESRLKELENMILMIDGVKNEKKDIAATA